MAKILAKTNEEMYDELLAYFEPLARESGEFERMKLRPTPVLNYHLPSMFYGEGKKQSIEKIIQVLNLHARSIVDLRNLQDYEFIRSFNVEWNDDEPTNGFQKNILLDCLHDVIAHLIDGVISEQDPAAYRLIMEKYS